MESQSINSEVDNRPESPSEAPTPAGTTTETQASSSSASVPTKQCSSCNEQETDPEKPLKPCSKCQSVQYCSRDCQKADFKKHKKVCAEKAQVYAMHADLKMAVPKAPKKEGHRGGLQKWQFDT